MIMFNRSLHVIYQEHDFLKYKIQSSVNNQHKSIDARTVTGCEVLNQTRNEERSVNDGTFMSTGHRDGQCNLRPGGDKQDSD